MKKATPITALVHQPRKVFSSILLKQLGDRVVLWCPERLKEFEAFVFNYFDQPAFLVRFEDRFRAHPDNRTVYSQLWSGVNNKRTPMVFTNPPHNLGATQNAVTLFNKSVATTQKLKTYRFGNILIVVIVVKGEALSRHQARIVARQYVEDAGLLTALDEPTPLETP